MLNGLGLLPTMTLVAIALWIISQFVTRRRNKIICAIAAILAIMLMAVMTSQT